MKWLYIILGLALLGFVLASCTSSEPSINRILDTLETKANEKDWEGVTALFAEDAVFEESYQQIVYDSPDQIELMWRNFLLNVPYTHELRDISVDGDSATFIWAGVTEIYTRLWPVKVEVQNGKIAFMDFYEDATRESTGQE
jgi:ketosteroid isomerase-like protein